MAPIISASYVQSRDRGEVLNYFQFPTDICPKNCLLPLVLHKHLVDISFMHIIADTLYRRHLPNSLQVSSFFSNKYLNKQMAAVSLISDIFSLPSSPCVNCHAILLDILLQPKNLVCNPKFSL